MRKRENLAHARDGAARAAPAAVPAVRRRHHVRADRGREAAVPRGHGWCSTSAWAGGWGGRYSYTWSRLEDNQFGEDSAYQTRTATPQNVYDLDAEYGISNFDSPHRIILAPIVRFPTPARNALLLGGWTASAIVELVSGSPLNAVMSEGVSDANLGLFGGRQRPNASGDPNTRGSDDGSRLVGRPSRRAVVQCRRVPESRRRTVRQRAADQRRRPLPVPQERRPGRSRRTPGSARITPRRSGSRFSI